MVRKLTRKFNKRKIRAILLILLLAVILCIFLRSSIFSIKTIEISGLNLLKEDYILNNIDFKKGNNIFRPDMDTNEADLTALPMISRAEISRRLPDKVRISIMERVPLALLPLESSCVQVDEKGIYLGTGSYGDAGLPLINHLEVDIGELGEKIKGENLDKVLNGIAQMPPELRERISEVNYSAQEGFVCYTLDGIQCRMGFPKDMYEKGKALLDILTNLQHEGRKVVYINMAYVGSPVVKYEE